MKRAAWSVGAVDSVEEFSGVELAESGRYERTESPIARRRGCCRGRGVFDAPRGPGDHDVAGEETEEHDGSDEDRPCKGGDRHLGGDADRG